MGFGGKLSGRRVGWVRGGVGGRRRGWWGRGRGGSCAEFSVRESNVRGKSELGGETRIYVVVIAEGSPSSGHGTEAGHGRIATNGQ